MRTAASNSRKKGGDRYSSSKSKYWEKRTDNIGHQYIYILMPNPERVLTSLDEPDLARTNNQFKFNDEHI
jgi:hypothetical protein